MTKIDNNLFTTVDAPPLGATQPRLSKWQQIVQAAHQMPSVWLHVKGQYANTSSPSSSAREAIRSLYGEGPVEHYEFAYQETLLGEEPRVEVYLRYAPPTPQHEAIRPGPSDLEEFFTDAPVEEQQGYLSAALRAEEI